MKTVIGVSHFFKNNTPKVIQIIGDISLLIAFLSGLMEILTPILTANGMVLPAVFATVNLWLMIGGSVVKFATKFFGIKTPAPDANTPA